MTAGARHILAQRLGLYLQRQRQRRGLTQAELAERADLSLKYVGEVERGEANVTVDTLGRVAVVLGWDPWSLFASDPPPVSQPVHQLLLGEILHAQQRLQTTHDWLRALDPARREPTSVPPPAPPARPASAPHITSSARPRRRGRPRKEGRDVPDA